MGKKSRSAAGVALADPPTEIPVVGGREPCPCGSGRRYKACHGRMQRAEAVKLVPRPFEGLPAEADWVAMREIVPAATGTVRTTRAHGDREVTVATVLPTAWPAMHRAELGGSIVRPRSEHRYSRRVRSISNCISSPSIEASSARRCRDMSGDIFC